MLEQGVELLANESGSGIQVGARLFWKLPFRPEVVESFELLRKLPLQKASGLLGRACDEVDELGVHGLLEEDAFARRDMAGTGLTEFLDGCLQLFLGFDATLEELAHP